MSPRTGLLGVLVPDETTRRAFEETLADWREEWQRASSPVERIRVSTRGWISVARLVVAAMRVGIASPDTWRAFAAVWVASAGLALLLIPAIGQWPLPLTSVAVAVVLLMPQALVPLLAPTAAIGLGTRPWREPNALTMAAVLTVTMVLMVGWVFPASNQMYREYVLARMGGNLVLARGLAEASAPELIRKAAIGRPDERRAATVRLSSRLALVVSAPVSFVFGVAVRRRLLGRTPWGIARFVAGASAVGVFLTVSFVMSLALRASPNLAYSDPRGLTVWFSSACLCVAVFALCQTANPEPDQRTLNLEP